MAEVKSAPKDHDFLFKIVLLGDSGVGKSSLMLRFADDVFNESFVSTIGVDYRFRTVNIDGKRVKLHLWDTAGQERYRALTSNYLRGSHGILVVYDVTSKETLDHITEWMVSVNKWAGDTVTKVLVGNKADLEDKRQVSTAEGEEVARNMGMLYFETSAKTATNVDIVFMAEAQEMLKIGIEKEAKRQSIVKIQESVNSPGGDKKGCCG
eukprot:TRINITY_DN3699_c0_g1_i1.p1 TRINITY_DN3699_c0_g1~~TRINITY_DN3699_c0_g1_i1.p1  ORF type:complete len:209 (+),score=58.28 TRINITY_DN3699_c0_g1_i1:64-690(+)